MLVTYHDGIDIAYHIGQGMLVHIPGFTDIRHCHECISDALGSEQDLATEAIYQRGVSFKSTYDGGSPIGYYRFYEGPSPDLPALHSLYQKMKTISHDVRSGLGCSSSDDDEMAYHLELLRYQPGTFFLRHTHERLPQGVGLICLLSEKRPGQGGTIFYSGDAVLNTAGLMQQGDLLFFPWDMEHEVSEVSVDERWVAVLPYY